MGERRSKLKKQKKGYGGAEKARWVFFFFFDQRLILPLSLSPRSFSQSSAWEVSAWNQLHLFVTTFEALFFDPVPSSTDIDLRLKFTPSAESLKVPSLQRLYCHSGVWSSLSPSELCRDHTYSLITFWLLFLTRRPVALLLRRIALTSTLPCGGS